MVHNFRVKTKGEKDCGPATGQGIIAHSLMSSFGNYLSGPLLPHLGKALGMSSAKNTTV